MRRILVFPILLALLCYGCGGGTDVNGNAGGGAETIDTPAREANSNMAPRGGPGPEPENAGSVSKNSNGGKAENSNGGKADNANKKADNENKKKEP